MSMEDGLPETIPLLDGHNVTNGDGGSSNGDTGSSRATAVLVLRTFVSVCGFFTVGCLDYNIASEATPTLVFIGLLLLTLSFSLGLAETPWIIMSEIYPINIKAAAGSLISLSYWSFSFAITYAFSFLLDWSSAGVFFVFSAVIAVTIVFVAKVVPETKLPQLEEIQASITHLHLH